MALRTNLISYWKLDETTGNAADSVGSNTLTNDSVTYVPGKIGNCASATNGSLQNDYTSWAAGKGAASVSFWFNSSSFPAGATSTILQIYWTDYVLMVYTSPFQTPTNALVIEGPNFDYITSAPTPGSWYNVVLTLDGANVLIYINGIYKTSKVISGTCSLTPQISLLRTNNGLQPMNGKVDEVGVWNRTLSSDEVSTLWNGGNGFAWPFIISPLPTSFNII